MFIVCQSFVCLWSLRSGKFSSLKEATMKSMLYILNLYNCQPQERYKFLVLRWCCVVLALKYGCQSVRLGVTNSLYPPYQRLKKSFWCEVFKFFAALLQQVPDFWDVILCFREIVPGSSWAAWLWKWRH